MDLYNNVRISIIFILIKFSFIASEYKNNNICLTGQTCVVKALSSITLVCQRYQDWYKSPNVLIGTYGNEINKEKYNISYQMVNLTKNQDNIYPLLEIKSADSSDSGFDSYYADIHWTDANCTYSTFVYDFIQNGIIDVPSSYNDSNGDFIIEIGSFDEFVNYTVKIEALPLDDIIIDNEIVLSNDCSNNNETLTPWLKCLESNILKKETSHCSNTIDISFTYSFAKEVYLENNISIKPNDFKQSFILKYPPQIQNENKYKNYTFSDTDEKIDLSVSIKCGEPTNFNWFFKNDSFINSTKENKISLKIEQYMKDFGSIEIYCIAENSVKSTDQRSRTDFSINYQSIAPRGLREYEIVIIVVCSFVAALLLVGSIIIVLLFRTKKDNSSINKEHEKNNDINMSTVISGRENELQKGLTDNPLYGSRSSFITTRSL